MSESFVDLSYRGLSLGKRIKLTQVRPTTGYLELPTPMPVGTPIGIATDDGVLLEAVVTEVREQVTGLDRVAGMLVKPKLDADGAQSWWKARADLGDKPVEKTSKVADKAPPPADAQGKVTLVSRRNDVAVPELVDDGRNTAVMEVAADDGPDKLVADVPIDADTNREMPAIPRELSARDTNPGMAVQRDSTPKLEAASPKPEESSPKAEVEDDGKRTMMMDAVDLAALGLDPASSSGQMQAVKPEDYVDDEPAATSGGNGSPGNGGDPNAGGGKKKKRKRR